MCRAAIELQFALLLFAAETAHRRVIAERSLTFGCPKNVKIEENLKQSSPSSLEQLYIN